MPPEHGCSSGAFQPASGWLCRSDGSFPSASQPVGRRRESSAALRLRGPGRGRCWATRPLRPSQGCEAGRPGTGEGSHGGGAFPQGRGCGPLRSRGGGTAGRPALPNLPPARLERGLPCSPHFPSSAPAPSRREPG